jgi:Domain of unknown function (DUF4105)
VRRSHHALGLRRIEVRAAVRDHPVGAVFRWPLPLDRDDRVHLYTAGDGQVGYVSMSASATLGNMARRAGLRLAIGLLAVAIVLMTGWGALAIYYSDVMSATVRTGLSAGFLVVTVLVFACVRPRRYGVLVFLLGFTVLVGWWVSIPPSNSRDWQPDVAVLAGARIEGGRLRVENVRNNEYRTEADYTPRYETRVFDLARLRSVDLFVSTWGSPLIAHTILSFGFAGDTYLAISIETRKTHGEDYSAVKGFFKQYELIYVVADERDVVRLRTNFRGEQVVLYRLRTTPSVGRRVLLDYLRRVNRLRDHPEWYNALTHNCTTAIRGHMVPHIDHPGSILSWKILLNGYLDELLYERQSVDVRLPLAQLRARGHINARARDADGDPAFSVRIREGVPTPPRGTAASR